MRRRHCRGGSATADSALSFRGIVVAMSLRRLISVLSVVGFASGSLMAAPKKDAKKKAPPAAAPAPAKDAGSAAPTPDAAAGSGSAVQMTEDAPPSDMNGTDENPDAPHDVFNTPTVVKTAPVVHESGYPIEEARRPITLPANMSEISISPHSTVSPASGTDALHARYGITRQVQLGLTYVWGGIYQAPTSMSTAFHPGKAVGLDVTVLLQNWLAVRVGVPVYIDPVAVGLQIGAPIKFSFGEKFALGGLDDLLLIKISKFAPSFYSEEQNATYATFVTATNTSTPDGDLRFSAYGVYNHTPQLAIIGRIGFDSPLGSAGGSSAGSMATANTTTFLRAGLQYSPKKYFDVGASLGFDDLAHGGTFSPQGFLAVRI
jgi:hypothetical protein